MIYLIKQPHPYPELDPELPECETEAEFASDQAAIAFAREWAQEACPSGEEPYPAVVKVYRERGAHDPQVWDLVTILNVTIPPVKWWPDFSK